MKQSAGLAAGLRLPLLAVVLAAGMAAAIPAAAGARTTGGTPGAAPAGATANTVSTLPGAWQLLPKAPIAKPPEDFGLTVAVWTGSQMIIHGAQFSGSGFSGITFAYRPAAGTWTRLPNGPRPIVAQSGDSAVWTGSQMLVFGLTAGAYRPSTNAWRPIARPPVGPSDISGWTGHEAITWEGVCCGNTVNSAEAYSPVTDKWRTTTAPLERRTGAMGAWTGKLLVVAGGFQEVNGTRVKVFRDGAAYNPATNTWRRLPPMPERRGDGTAVWDGKEVLFLGGTAPGSKLPSLRGMAYNPQANSWRLLPAMEFRRQGFVAVSTGRQLLVWGGQFRQSGTWTIPPHGEAFNLVTNRWSALPVSPLHGRQGTSAVWTGRRMIIWGGYYFTPTGGLTSLLDGATFTPSSP